ncbi:hypothetical protein HPP92_009562 [Vanilla planifolia]|uniref:Xaa-Pro aminopeptidase n=1 Tax=Vanilla planifolia TaxID=51239 RepID=A0A835V5J6_VANPL|nr:hypothetical protein HPP92_009562 [Vanilla planifolia]
MAVDPLDALRSLMASHSTPLDAFIVPSEDNHQSEYVSDRDKRRAFVSGFTGSAGLALITMTEALLWTDGRYFLQATQQLSDRWKLICIMEDPNVENWISDNLPSDAAVGIDPWCVSVEMAQKWTQAFSKKRQKLVHLSVNLVDEIWKDRPAADIQPVHIQPFKFAGRAVADKLKDLREKLLKEKADGIIVTALDEVSWLYNIRGNDVSYCPVVHAYAIVKSDSAFLYVDKRKLSQEVSYSFGIICHPWQCKLAGLGKLNSSVANVYHNQALVPRENVVNSEDIQKEVHSQAKSQKIWIDPDSCCLALYSRLNSDQVVMKQSPLALAKALKNSVELDGLRKAHIRDGAAVVQYLVWLDGQMQSIYGAAGYFDEPAEKHNTEPLETEKLTEVSVSDKLESFRAKQEYQDGTTDITRTVHFGKPSAHEKACYTAVLKGHIALGNAVFPNGTTGFALDVIARLPLWKNGLDYRHGTGHGIGSYLNVHEGFLCCRASFDKLFRPHARNVPLQASMTVTDEPGYYEDGNFGIRLENVLVVKEAEAKFNFGGRGYLSFEHITWAPYQKKLLSINSMTLEEVSWLNSYHSSCREVLAPYLNDQEKEWLQKATEPLLL